MPAKKREHEGESERGLKKAKDNKKTRAVCFGYLGTGYHGSQRQTGSELPTIEGELEQAMIEAGLLDEANSQKWTRAARTDKGVHAVVNIVTMSLGDEISDLSKINEILKPKNMEIYFAHKVIGRFDARLQCDKRRYEYLIPKNISGSLKDNLESAFAVFKGTHNFHNFTSGLLPSDPQALRFIISTEVLEVDDDLLKIVLVGQSFLLNQIRKMVACAVEYSLGKISLEDIKSFLSPEVKRNMRMAPAEGLLLDRLFYEMYDENKSNYKDILPIAWSFTEAEDRIRVFKETIVYPQVKAKLPAAMETWLSTVFSEEEEVSI
jgi:tRNA pseudouridine38-40 synthase